ncbi:MAG: dihydrodipicolinate synthase family protein [Chloroflexi bacterium]|nr:dihydrodipicolinate synthase family protein [Chloroflexota bacterium]
MAKKLDKSKLKGVASLTLTPLKKDFSLNEDSCRKTVEWLIKNECTSMWIRGWVGEWPQLTLELSKRMFEVYAEQNKGRALIGAGCHSNRTAECIELVNYAEEVGCDFAWMTPPLFPTSNSNEEIYNHYKMIVENTKNIPLGVYNSGGTLVYMTPKLILDIINLSPRFVVLKDSHSFSSHQLGLFKLGIHKKVAYYPMSGSILPGLILGAAGPMTASPAGVPLSVKLYKAFLKGDMDKAWELQLEMIGDPPHLGAVGQFLRPYVIPQRATGISKARLSLEMGIDMGPPAPPNAPATKEDIEAIKKSLGLAKKSPAKPRAAKVRA